GPARSAGPAPWRSVATAGADGASAPAVSATAAAAAGATLQVGRKVGVLQGIQDMGGSSGALSLPLYHSPVEHRAHLVLAPFGGPLMTRRARRTPGGPGRRL